VAAAEAHACSAGSAHRESAHRLTAAAALRRLESDARADLGRSGQQQAAHGTSGRCCKPQPGCESRACPHASRAPRKATAVASGAARRSPGSQITQRLRFLASAAAQRSSARGSGAEAERSRCGLSARLPCAASRRGAAGRLWRTRRGCDTARRAQAQRAVVPAGRLAATCRALLARDRSLARRSTRRRRLTTLRERARRNWPAGCRSCRAGASGAPLLVCAKSGGAQPPR